MSAVSPRSPSRPALPPPHISAGYSKRPAAIRPSNIGCIIIACPLPRTIDADACAKMKPGSAFRTPVFCPILRTRPPFACQKGVILPVPALRAEALILHIIHRIDGHLLPFKHEGTVHLAPVAGGLFAPQEQMVLSSSMVCASSSRRVEPGKPRSIEICPKAVADDRDVLFHHNPEQLLRLLGRKELALVAENAGQRTARFPSPAAPFQRCPHPAGRVYPLCRRCPALTPAGRRPWYRWMVSKSGPACLARG